MKTQTLGEIQVSFLMPKIRPSTEAAANQTGGEYMGVEIDRLEVQVEAQATKANNQLDALVKKLDALSGSLSHLNSSGLTGLANGVAKFAQASGQLSNVKATDFNRLAKNIEKLSKLNTQQIYSAASSMNTLSSAMNRLSGASAGTAQISQLW